MNDGTLGVSRRHPGGGRGPDKKDAHTARLAWIPDFAHCCPGKDETTCK